MHKSIPTMHQILSIGNHIKFGAERTEISLVINKNIANSSIRYTSKK